MRYTFIPNSFNYSEIGSKFTDDSYLEVQLIYKRKLEEILKRIVDFSKLDEYMEMDGLEVPIVGDSDYNFYHISSLGSKYFFLRNNIHIERLTPEELQELYSTGDGISFILKTLPRVLFEDGGIVFFGPSSPANEVKAKSIVFEFAFDMLKCESMDAQLEIYKRRDEMFKFIEENIRKVLNIDFSFITYGKNPDIFSREMDTQLDELKTNEIV